MSKPDLSVRLESSPNDLTFEGVGAVSAGASSRLLIDYPEPQRSRILDLLFKPNCGAAFQHLKVEVGGDMNSTDGSEPSHMRKRGEACFDRGYEWWLMKEAVKRNPKIILDCLAWGAPGWFDGGFWSQDCADYYVSFLKGAKEVHGLTLSYVGLWNEREFDPAFVKTFRRTLDRAGFKDVGIVASDMNGPPEHQWKAAELASKDPELARAISVFGIHYPYTVPPDAALQFQMNGKGLWSSEDGEWNWQTMRPLDGLRAQKINRNIIERRLTKTEFWSPVTAYYPCLAAPDSGVIIANTPWSGNWQIKDQLWHVAHTTHFVQPGWKLLASASRLLPKGGSMAAYQSPDGREVSLVAETAGAKEPQRLQVTGFSDQKSLACILTGAGSLFERQPDIALSDEACSFTLLPDQVVTLTTLKPKKKASLNPPTARPFPLPFREDFQGVEQGRAPKYFSDFSWAFEGFQTEEGRKVLRQVIEQQGITWLDLPYASTYLGDPAWQDVTVSCRVALEEENAKKDDWAGVVARALPGATWDGFKNPYPAGFTLSVTRDGRWRVADPKTVLAEGRLESPHARWTHLSLALFGDSLTAKVNSQAVASLKVDPATHGLAGLACGSHPALYDDFSVTSSQTGPAVPKGLRVRGAKLFTPQGRPIHLRGFNAMWWVAPSSSHARLMKSMGANAARYMFGRSTPGRPVSKVDEIVEQVERLTDAGLWVIPTVHDFRTNGKAPYDDPAVQKEFLDMWQAVILRLRNNPLIAAWEPMNEPHDATPERVSAWYAEVIKFFRTLDPHRPIVVEGTGYSWPQNLEDGLIQRDPHIIYSFHTYGPWDYVAQKPGEGVPYPGKWTKQDLADAIRPAVEFRERHQVPVWCGEWGVPSGLKGSLDWIDDVAAVLEEFEIPWTYWTWAEKPENPLHDTFDVNPKKAELYRHMAALFRRTAKAKPSIKSLEP